MKEPTAEIFICQQCKLLLMKVDEKFTGFSSARLTTDGLYSSNYNPEMDFDSYFCPRCSVSDEEDDGIESKEIPQSACSHLIALWEKLKQSVPNNDYTYEYGIPLKEPELKELLTEHLI